MPSPLTRRAALTGAVAVTLVGCSNPVELQPANPSEAPTVAGDGAQVADKEYFARSTYGTQMSLDEGTWGAQRVSTPHLDFELRAWAAGDRLSAATLAQVDVKSELKAPNGQELVAFALAAGVPAYESESRQGASPYVVVGDRSIELPGLFDKFSADAHAYTRPWEFLVLCAPKGAPVQLHVVDEGRTVMVDLRTGVPIRDKDGAWDATRGFRERQWVTCDPSTGVFHRRLEATPPNSQKDETTLRIGLRPQPVSGLLPWTPTLGWAPAGKQWLPVPMDPKVDVVGKQMLPLLAIQVAKSFTYIDEEGGKTEAAHPKLATTEAIARGQEDLVVMWPVSGQDAEALILFNPVGVMEVAYQEVPRVPAEFNAPAVPLQFKLTFAPDA